MPLKTTDHNITNKIQQLLKFINQYSEDMFISTSYKNPNENTDLNNLPIVISFNHGAKSAFYVYLIKSRHIRQSKQEVDLFHVLKQQSCLFELSESSIDIQDAILKTIIDPRPNTYERIFNKIQIEMPYLYHNFIKSSDMIFEQPVLAVLSATYQFLHDKSNITIEILN